MTQPGLRERKKAATRAALSRAAWTMLLADGLESVTPESVSAAADMAPRTFRYHFRNREEAILDELAQQHLALADRIRERPPAEPIWDSLLAVLPPEVVRICGDRAVFATLLRVIGDDPAMLAQNLTVLEHSRISLARVIAERAGGQHPGTYPNLLAGVAVTAISTAVTHWALDTTGTDLAAVLHDCLQKIREGLS
ncbi:TetR/AcrR family transcriptional regulator [Actinoplanes couchii]|nr:TetR family transcriptional regulator [Actinoplanes couchii]MDR6318621.1 AcrR family transcriptional regulator [Actinoplanes couchii]